MDTDWNSERQLLEAAGVALLPGLSEAEILEAAQRFEFRFPPDLRSMLMAFLPSGRDFPAWRGGEGRKCAERFAWPFDGIAFDIRNNEFWFPAWGEKPDAIEEAVEVARAEVAKVPKLVPLYSHRYLPSEPHEAGNPVFSVYQTDIIYYGRDLRAYLQTEFGGMKWAEAVAGDKRSIEFWTRLIDEDF